MKNSIAHRARRALVLTGVGTTLVAALLPTAQAAAPTTAPQVLLTITNSESMDGTTSGAIMVGSGGIAGLSGASSPVTYTIPSGFTPPVNAGSAGVAKYTYACGSNLCDNGPSRLNLAKAAMAQVIASYATTINFGIYDYSTSGTSLYNTWVYLMSRPGGFTFTNTFVNATNTPNNPCYGYTSSPNAYVQSNCAALVTAGLYTSGTLGGSLYINALDSSDEAMINDVLYMSGGTSYPVFVSWGTVTPANPYTYYSLNTYETNIGGYTSSYSKLTPSFTSWATTPTNAGYVPYSPQVMYAMRGWGYGGSQSATTGHTVVTMSTDPNTSTAFTTALAPETNSASTAEIKSVAGQSAIAGLVAGARSYLGSITHASCQNQYVVLLTDGLPTMDLQGRAWPPLGTVTANHYGLTATFNADGSFASSNSQAVTDAIASITAAASAGIKTYVIGLGAGVNSASNPIAAQVLQAMAIAGGTNSFFPATDANSLTSAFNTIVYQIYTDSAVAAPIAPISVSSGGAFEYSLVSNPEYGTGDVSAYAVASTGNAAQNPSWDAATLMTTTQRSTGLMAPNASGTSVGLNALDTAAFNLSATSCVPNTATIVSYLVNPSYSYNACSYLAGRQQGAFLDLFSTQNTGKYVGPPAAGALVQRYTGYTSYASSNALRSPMLMFSNNDGFIYAVNPTTGALLWGWTTRNLIAKMQNYSTFASGGYANGNFVVVDAQNASGQWGSYLVGSLQSGAEHFSVQLSSQTGAAASYVSTPTTLVYDYVTGGTSPGDATGATGAVPLRQPVLIAYVGSSAYAVYVVNSGATSTLYEVNVATGVSSSSVLPGFTLSSALYLNSVNNELFMGGADGSLWETSIVSGNAATDVGYLQKIGTMVNPVSGATVHPVLYVGYSVSNGTPYTYAVSAGQVTLFNVTASGWTPLWAATTSAAYSYNGSGFTLKANAATLTSGSSVSDQPTVVAGALVVPVGIPGSACSPGQGAYDFFSLATGSFPTLPFTLNGVVVTAPIMLGTKSSAALNPSVTLTGPGLAINLGAVGAINISGTTCNGICNAGTPAPPLLSKNLAINKHLSWLQR